MRNNNSGKLAIPEAGTKAPASFMDYSPHVPENGFRKWGAFTLGVVAGVVAVTMAQRILEDLPHCGYDTDRKTTRHK